MALTITEALAEIKTIQARLTKKREFITRYIARQDGQKDPLANEGGSREAIKRERQAMTDLEARIVAIRAAIQRANASTSITVGATTRPIADWLVWRREVAPNTKAYVAGIIGGLASMRADAQRKGLAVRGDEKEVTSPNDIVVNVEEKALADEVEAMESTLGTLDGQLSLKNATTVIEV